MQPSLEQDEIDYLSEHFRLTTTLSPERRGSIDAVGLLERQGCVSYLDEVSSLIGSPSKMVTASQFSKRYSYLTVIPSLYALTVFNKGLDLSIENIHIESVYQDQNWLPRVRFAHLQVANEPKREEVLETLFAKNLSKVWRSLSETVGISYSILWENTAIYVYWFYEKRMEQEGNPQVNLRIQEDFQYLIHEAPASLFGEKENPLAKFYSDPGNRTRKTCCYYYQLSSHHDYCSTCPKVRKKVF
ncbi:IucA/IucC family C-terminal-domain containing protein [Ammoniphilus sp. YIM 78166]|uniref:IucA/IucC family C-terminal-domain containing protein n=1 Tax=Ammoniphilus sp. YIM 78166 TaxID=1644106 RepID=UPI00106FEE45|nr:IucA/IucC family C-terminal-domain containing protein [Ammoniphilus sp. YIM 78166]